MDNASVTAVSGEENMELMWSGTSEWAQAGVGGAWNGLHNQIPHKSVESRTVAREDKTLCILRCRSSETVGIENSAHNRASFVLFPGVFCGH